MTDDMGRLVAQPLCCGGEYCVLHAKPFVVRPAPVIASPVLVYLDLETTGVDVSRDRIVELAATHASADARLAGSSFSTVVQVAPQILQERGAAAAAVHGIADEEIARGPSFPETWRRFLQWVQGLLDDAVRNIDTDTEDDEPREPQVEESPVLLLAAHNGLRFDFPLLLCELLRHGLPCWQLEQWRFVDTLPVLQATTGHGCVKLQCLSLRILAETGRAHRALDDCVSLRQVMRAASLVLGTSAPSLLARFAYELDAPSSLAQLAVLMTDAPVGPKRRCMTARARTLSSRGRTECSNARWHCARMVVAIPGSRWPPRASTLETAWPQLRYRPPATLGATFRTRPRWKHSRASTSMRPMTPAPARTGLSARMLN